jgi:acyl carrier protein
MDRDAIFEKLKAVFIEFFQDEDLVITEETSPKDIEDWDSVSHIQLVFEIEEVFGIQFEAEDIVGLDSVGVISDKIQYLID